MRSPTILATCILLPALPGQLPVPDRGSFAEDIRAAMRRVLRSTEATAITLAVAVDGKTWFTHSLGTLRPDGPPAHIATLFPLGDCSRLVTNLLAARLHQRKLLDLDAPLNPLIAPLALRDVRGKAQQANLRGLLRGQPHLPAYENYFTAERRDTWTLERALRENAFTDSGQRMPHPFRKRLAYGFFQVAAERRSGKPWADLVRTELARPLGLLRLVVGKGDVPRDKAVALLQGGGLQPPTPNPHSHCDIPAAGGAWVDAQDLGRLLCALPSKPGAGMDAFQLRKFAEHPALANFDVVTWKPARLLSMQSTSPGSTAGVRHYPQFGRSWATILNYRSRTVVGVPETLGTVLRRHLLPPPKSISSAGEVGLGGRAGRGAREIPRDQRGNWEAAVRLDGKTQTLRMTLGARGATHTRFAGGAQIPVKSELRDRLEVRGRGLLPVHPERRLHATMVLRQIDQNGEAQYLGRIDLRGKHSRMSLPLRFRRVKPARRDR